MTVEKFIENVKKTVNKQRRELFIFTFLLGIVVHFACYSARVIGNPDTIYNGGVSIAGKWSASLGRWALLGLDRLRGGVASNVLVSIISIIFMALAAVLLVEFLEIKSGLGFQYLACGLVAVSPAFAMLLTYYYCSDFYALSILCVVAGCLLIKEKELYKNIIGIGFLIFSMGIYQAYISLAAVLLLYDIISTILKKASFIDNIKKLGKYVLCGGISLISYYVFTMIVLKIFHLSLSNYSGANEIGIINSLLLLPQSVCEAYKTFFDYFFTGNMLNNTSWNIHILAVILFGLTVILLIIYVIKEKIYKNVLNICLLVISLCLFPLAANFIRLITTSREVGLLMGVPLGFVFSILLGIISKLTDDFKNIWIPWVVTMVVSVALIVSYSFMDNATYMARRVTYDKIYGIAMRMLDRAEALNGTDDNLNIMIVGDINKNPHYQEKEVIYEMADKRASEWGMTWSDYHGIYNCWKGIFRTYFGVEYEDYTYDEYLDTISLPEFEEMGVFPEENSVKTLNGYIVIKLDKKPVMLKQ